jgi:FkbM family methyltransferase
MWVHLHAALAAGRQPVMLDIGMNAGFFSALATSLGARVYAFEPQPACIANAALANPAFGIKMFNHAVSARNATLRVPADACDPGNTIFGERLAGHTVSTANIGSLWDIECMEQIDVVKIDVEGAELSVLEALLPLIESKRVGAFIIEIAFPATIHYWPQFGYTLESGTRFIEKAFRGRYTLESLFSPDLQPSAAAHCSEHITSTAMGLPPYVSCTGAAAAVYTVKDFSAHLQLGGGNYMFRRLP